MAINAQFVANFSSFYDAVDKASVKLDNFSSGAARVGSRLNTLGNQFSGQNIIKEASLMVKAIGGIEGIATLTEKELARLGGTVNEAVSKMKLLKMDIPAEMQKVADATKGANKATTDWMGTLGKFAGTLGIAFSVSTITNFIGGVLDAADAIQDMSLEWGVSTDAVQQWTYAASQSGVEAATVGKSMQYLTEKLSDTSGEYAALLANVGLSADKLRAMPLEEAYREIIGAIGGIEDETLQLDIALGLLGPSAKRMIGAIRDGMLETADAHKGMTQTTIKELADAKASWENFYNSLVIWSGNALAAISRDVKTMTGSWKSFAATIGIALQHGDFRGFLAGLRAAEEATEKLATEQADLTRFVDKGAVAVTRQTGALRTSAEIHEENRKKEEALKKALQDRAKAQEEVNRTFEAYNKAVADYNQRISALAANLSGDTLIARANELLAALKESIPVQQMTREKQDEINKSMTAAIDVYRAAGQQVPKELLEIQLRTMDLIPAIEAVKTAAADLVRIYPKLIDMPLPNNATMAGPPGMFKGLGKDLAGDMSKAILGAIQGGGNIFQAAGSAIGTRLLDPKLSGIGAEIGKQAAKLPGILGSAIGGAIPVVGSLIGPAVGWLGGKIAGLFGKKEHEKLRDNFIKAAGGITELRAASDAAGFSLDNLLRAKNTDAVKAAIEGIQKSIEFQATAYDAAIEAAQRYGFTLEELGPAMARQELDKQAQQLYKDWEVLNSAGIDTVKVTEKMAESVNAYVKQAKAMGMQVPSAMRPMLDAFAKSGQLIDENGNAITNLEDAGINFAMTMSEGFQSLIKEVRTLTDAIARSLGIAIRNVPDIEVEGRVTWDVDPIPKPDSPTIPMEGYQEGTHGFKNFGSGTPVMLHGWEAVVPREESTGGAAFATVQGGGLAVTPAAAAAPTVIINAQGAFFDTPGDLQRLADRVNEALTAKFGLRNIVRAG